MANIRCCRIGCTLHVYTVVMCAYKLKGLSKLNSLLTRMETDLLKEAEQELKKIADAILADALSRVPVDKGQLRASAFVDAIENGWTLGFSASYAAYQEFGTGPLTEVPQGYEDYAMEFFVSGTGNTPAQPFLFPAFLKERDSIVDKLALGLNEYLKSK